jgi:hypothetical protein
MREFLKLIRHTEELFSYHRKDLKKFSYELTTRTVKMDSGSQLTTF